MEKYWWFGINNLANGEEVSKSRPHVTYAQIAPVIAGQQKEFAWPHGGTPVSQKYYQEMLEGDKFLLWMGDGSYQKNWGIIGFGRIDRILTDYKCKKFNKYMLHMTYVPSVPIIPYPSQHPQETSNTEFLKKVFGIDFRPLSKVFKKLGYRDKIFVITLETIKKEQYEAALNRAKEYSNMIISEESEDEKTGYVLSNAVEIELLDEVDSLIKRSKLDITVKEQWSNIRIGQERFRKDLIKYWNGCCAVTGFQETRILRASHIKPWRLSNDYERLDLFNGLLLIPNLDAVFDQALITFDEHGKIIIHPSFKKNAILLGITEDMAIALDDRHQKYMAYHRKLYRGEKT